MANADLALRKQLDEDWNYWMTQYPETATALGYPGQNARWTDYSAHAISERERYLEESAKRLAKIDTKQLSAADRIDYAIYRDALEAAVAGVALHNDAAPMKGVIPHNLLMPMNQMEGIQQEIPHVLAMMPRTTHEEYDNIVRRLERVAELVEQTIALMQRGLDDGLTPPRITLRDLPRQVKAQLHDDPLKSPMLEAFLEMPHSIEGGAQAALKKRAIDAYRTTVAPAFSKLDDFVTSRYLPACRDTTAASALPNGAELYAFNVKWHTTLSKTPREIHEIGLAEVQRIRSAMDAVIASTGFKGSYDDFKHFLRTDPQFFCKDAESLLSAYRDIAKRADPELARLFASLPQTPYGVKPVPDATAPSQTTAYYDPGSFAIGRPAYMYANTYKLESRPKWEMEALTLHEAVPGHHLQISIAQELTDMPEFRKNSSYTAYVEGWALYAESLGYEMGFYKDPYSRFGALTYEMWRALRLVVDTGLHAMGWTRDQAIDLFRQNTAKTDQDITVEIDRYIVWPGQALGYKMGQLKILELRKHAEQRLGPRFDIRQFHDALLRHGAVPLEILERQIETWVSQFPS